MLSVTAKIAATTTMSVNNAAKPTTQVLKRVFQPP
jgi:hypothetical protein